MLLKVGVEHRFERVVADRNDDPGKVHITLNGAPICEMWTRKRFREHPAGIEQVGFAEFVKDACGLVNGEVGTRGCAGVLERGLSK
jgi:hypothetical protein